MLIECLSLSTIFYRVRVDCMLATLKASVTWKLGSSAYSKTKSLVNSVLFSLLDHEAD